ncbi:chemotaxis protein CheB [Umboniibacter marinipuniceus]|uniref:protein-glutamate methylesterase n=1 Tax=Umboniibacter marinipuniceus TaxID=569599 RepID=A0A3M0ATH7_9GAMM|nr:chemotaxis protein CheB [Umboniibacter marinipuniceus]RMA82232.1 CheB methylesterase [Umboniibacter marinipuniceus]
MDKPLIGLLANDLLALSNQRAIAKASGFKVAFSAHIDDDWTPNDNHKEVACWLHGRANEDATSLAVLVSDGQLPSLNTRGFDNWVSRLKQLDQHGCQSLTKLIILAASTGGPQVIGQLLAQLPVIEDAALLVVQHQSVGAERSMIDQFSKQGRWPVVAVQSVSQLAGGYVYVLSAEDKVTFGSNLTLARSSTPWSGKFAPSIDHVVGSVTKRFRGQSLVIYLSGLSGEGPSGARLAQGAGATIWVQDPASAVADGMINDVKAVINVEAQIHPNDIADAVINWTVERRPQCRL